MSANVVCGRSPAEICRQFCPDHHGEKREENTACKQCPVRIVPFTTSTNVRLS